MTHDILSDLAAARQSFAPRCWLGKLRVSDPELAEAYDRAVADPRHFSDEAIANWFNAHGAPVAKGTIQRHRVGDCAECQKRG